jgi:hypothetical protein
MNKGYNQGQLPFISSKLYAINYQEELPIYLKEEAMECLIGSLRKRDRQMHMHACKHIYIHVQDYVPWNIIVYI